MKKVKILSIILSIISIVAIAMIALFSVQNIKIQTMQNDYNALKALDDAQKKTIYVATMDIKAGDMIATSWLADALNDEQKDFENQGTENIVGQEVATNVVEQAGVYSSLDDDLYITIDEIGQIAKIDITAGSPITKDMVAAQSLSKDLREYEIAAARIMTDQSNNDYIDLRILYPDGSDYLVLGKKLVKNLHYENSLFFSYLNEEEIERYSSAVIDAYTITGTVLYTTRYVESTLQDDPVPNYLVRSNVQDLIATNPNILTIAQETLNYTARLDLERRLSALTEEQLAAVAQGQGLQDTANKSVIQENVSVYSDYIDTQEYDENGEYATIEDTLEDTSNNIDITFENDTNEEADVEVE